MAVSKFVGALGCLFIVGCSSAPNSTLLGTWQLADGSTTLTCDDSTTTQPLPEENTDTWREGSTEQLELTNEFGTLVANLQQDAASLASQGTWLEYFPGQGEISSVTGVPAGTRSGSVSLTSYEFRLGDDPSTARETFAGTVSITTDAGTSMPCQVNATATYDKLH